VACWNEHELDQEHIAGVHEAVDGDAAIAPDLRQRTRSGHDDARQAVRLMSDDLAAALALVESVRGDIRAGHAERTRLTALCDAAERLAGGRAEDRRANENGASMKRAVELKPRLKDVYSTGLSVTDGMKALLLR
jgi:hypothetical protein